MTIELHNFLLRSHITSQNNLVETAKIFDKVEVFFVRIIPLSIFPFLFNSACFFFVIQNYFSYFCSPFLFYCVVLCCFVPFVNLSVDSNRQNGKRIANKKKIEPRINISTYVQRGTNTMHKYKGSSNNYR